MSRNPIACRVESYHPFEALAWGHLASIGVRNVEIAVPSPTELDQTAAKLKEHGLAATTLHGQCDVSRADVAEQIRAQMHAFDAFGTRLMFVSVKAGETPLDMVYARLRAAGDVAGEHGVTMVLETHPDLVTNAEVARRTMEGVNHPHVRVNYDTANVYFYNHDVNAAKELEPIVPWVGAVHLKDTDGGYRHWHFPALGQGTVPFADVFKVLDSAGFAGPYTLEIEGIEGETATEQLVCERISKSVEYLRGLGRM